MKQLIDMKNMLLTFKNIYGTSTDLLAGFNPS